MVVGIFLNNNPRGICHVTVQKFKGQGIVIGDCRLAAENRGSCKHTDRVIRNYHEHGNFRTEIDANVTEEMVAEAKKLPDGYRDLMIHRSKIMVV